MLCIACRAAGDKAELASVFMPLASFAGCIALVAVRAVLGLRGASKGVSRTIKTSATRCTRRRAVELSPWLTEQKALSFWLTRELE